MGVGNEMWVGGNRAAFVGLAALVLAMGCREPQHQRDEPGEGDLGLEIRRRTAAGTSDRPRWRWHWEAFDEDGNGRINPGEWEDRLEDWFDAADRNDDDRLTEAELEQAIHRWWDQDGDGHVERSEFDPARVRAFGADERFVDLRTWDRNLDLRLDPAEFAEGWRAMGLWNRWDADGDGVLTEAELVRGWFDSWDTDGSGALERREWAWSATSGA